MCLGALTLGGLSAALVAAGVPSSASVLPTRATVPAGATSGAGATSTGPRWMETSYFLRLPGQPSPPTSSGPASVLSVQASVEGGATAGSVFGAGASRTLVVTVANVGAVPAQAVVTATWGRGTSPSNPVGTPVIVDLAPGRSATVTLPFSLSALSAGSYQVVGQVSGSAPTASFATTTTTWPWGIPLVAVVLLLAGIVASERSRRRALRPAHAHAYGHGQAVSPPPSAAGPAVAGGYRPAPPAPSPVVAPGVAAAPTVPAVPVVAPGGRSVPGVPPASPAPAGSLRLTDVWLIGVLDGMATTAAVAVLSFDSRGIGVTDAATYGQRVLPWDSVRSVTAASWLGRPGAPAGLVDPGAIVVVETERSAYRFAVPGRSAESLSGPLADASRGWVAPAAGHASDGVPGPFGTQAAAGQAGAPAPVAAPPAPPPSTRAMVG